MIFTRKHTKTYPLLYEITINMGGLVHPEIRELKYNEELIGYWDETEEYGFMIEDKRVWGLDKSSDGCWNFTSPIKRDAEVFFQGAMATVEFMQQLWFSQYVKKK